MAAGVSSPSSFVAPALLLCFLLLKPSCLLLVILPASALALISTLNLQFPLMFQLRNPQFPEKVTHAGVLEFTAPEGKCIIPFWMMQNIRLEPNGFAMVTSKTLRAAQFVKFQPQSPDFLDITNPRAVLEQKLRGYSVLTKGDIVLFRYNNKDFYLEVLEIQPDDALHAVSIIETDVKVDFAPPIGYKEPERPAKLPEESSKPVDKTQLDPSQVLEESEDSEDEAQSFSPFQGAGARISGKKVDAAALAALEKKRAEEKKAAEPKVATVNDKGDLVFKSESELGELRKQREQRQADREKREKEDDEKKKKITTNDGKKASEFKPFAGQGYKLSK